MHHNPQQNNQVCFGSHNQTFGGMLLGGVGPNPSQHTTYAVYQMLQSDFTSHLHIVPWGIGINISKHTIKHITYGNYKCIKSLQALTCRCDVNVLLKQLNNNNNEAAQIQHLPCNVRAHKNDKYRQKRSIKNCSSYSDRIKTLKSRRKCSRFLNLCQFSL